MASTSMIPFHPDKIRVAGHDEIDRIALVAAAGFYYSPANAYERPKRDQYPNDTVQSYYHQALTCLWDPDRILIVALDKHDKSEDKKLYPALRESHGGRKWPEKEGKLVVGFACLTLRKHSSRKGEFQPPGEAPHIPDDGEGLKRDQNQEGLDKLAGVVEQAIDRHFKDEFSVDMLAVHPQYWRNGHGTSLLLWASQLADKDEICIGIASVPMAVQICCNVGFKMTEEITVEGYPEHRDGFIVWIGRREAKAVMSLPECASHGGWSLSWLFSGVMKIFSK